MRRAYGCDASECQNFVIQAFIRNFAVNFNSSAAKELAHMPKIGKVSGPRCDTYRPEILLVNINNR